MKKQIAVFALISAFPMAHAQNATPREKKDMGAPSQEVYESKPEVDRPDPKQTTGARDKDIGGSPSQKTFSTKPETVESTNTIAQIADNTTRLSTFASAVEAAGLTETLGSAGPFTIFAPSDEAFAALPDGTLDELLKPENKESLTHVLMNHVMPGIVSSQMIKAGEIKMNSGETAAVALKDGNVMVNDAKVIQPDLYASNGVIHIIDKVLIPESE